MLTIVRAALPGRTARVTAAIASRRSVRRQRSPSCRSLSSTVACEREHKNRPSATTQRHSHWAYLAQVPCSCACPS